jgi:hypothetical protein
MAATQSIDTPERDGSVINAPVAAATKLFGGTLGAVNAAGEAVPAADTAGLKVVGRVESEVDNSAGVAGALTVDLKRGVFKLANSATDAVTAAEKQQIVYVEDDQTVCKTGGTNKIVAGVAVAVEADGVWVDTKAPVVRATATVVLGNANSEISGVEIGAPASIAPQNADNEIAALTFTALGATGAECEALRDKCEDLAEDVIALDTALQTAATKATVETLRGKLEELADDLRAIKAALDAAGITG